MKYGVISDIHGNLPALEATLEKLTELSVDEIITVGDMSGVLGWPEETAQRVREASDHTVFGNHDARVMSDFTFVPDCPVYRQEHEVVTGSYSAETIEWLDSLPEVVEVDGMIIGHANPYDDPVHGYPAQNYQPKSSWTSFASEYMDGETAIFGHTHEQGYLDVSKFPGLDGHILNPGSVGQPYDKTAQFATVDTDTNSFELHQTHYDYQKVRSRLQEVGINKNPERGFDIQTDLL